MKGIVVSLVLSAPIISMGLLARRDWVRFLFCVQFEDGNYVVASSASLPYYPFSPEANGQLIVAANSVNIYVYQLNGK